MQTQHYENSIVLPNPRIAIIIVILYAIKCVMVVRKVIHLGRVDEPLSLLENRLIVFERSFLKVLFLRGSVQDNKHYKLITSQYTANCIETLFHYTNDNRITQNYS